MRVTKFRNMHMGGCVQLLQFQIAIYQPWLKVWAPPIIIGVLHGAVIKPLEFEGVSQISRNFSLFCRSSTRARKMKVLRAHTSQKKKRRCGQ